jgi:hypothetical protein
MTCKFALILFFLFYSIAVGAQANDIQIEAVLAKKITVSGFCLCKTTFGDLKKLSNDFKLVDVEEMDLGKICIGSGDSHYENGKGYYSIKYHCI